MRKSKTLTEILNLTLNLWKKWRKKCLESPLVPIDKFFRRCRGLKLWARMQQTSAVVRRYLATFSSGQHQFGTSCWSGCSQYKPPTVEPRMMCNGLRQVQYFVKRGFLSKRKMLWTVADFSECFGNPFTFLLGFGPEISNDFNWLFGVDGVDSSLENRCTGPDSLGLETTGQVDLQCQICNFGMQIIISRIWIQLVFEIIFFRS